MQQVVNPEGLVRRVVEALDGQPMPMLGALDDLPAPVYATDSEGLITWYSTACIDFAGRIPVANQDRWCVTWKLFTNDGRPLPHDQCPMAMAIREQRLIRGLAAVAERPDGRRVNFRPYPTPLFDATGTFTGAVNLLLDITGDQQRHYFLEQARRCRRLVGAVNDLQMIRSLERMAIEYEAKALALTSVV